MPLSTTGSEVRSPVSRPEGPLSIRLTEAPPPTHYAPAGSFKAGSIGFKEGLPVASESCGSEPAGVGDSSPVGSLLFTVSAGTFCSSTDWPTIGAGVEGTTVVGESMMIGEWLVTDEPHGPHEHVGIFKATVRGTSRVAV